MAPSSGGTRGNGMRGRGRVVALGVGLLLILLSILGASPAQAAMDKPVWSPGDFWVYNLRSNSSSTPLNATIRMDVVGTEPVAVNGTSYSSYHVRAELRIPFGIFSITIPADLWYSTDTLAMVKLHAVANLSFSGTPNEIDITISGNPPQTIRWPLAQGATWSSSTVVWSTSVANGTVSISSEPLATDFVVEADQTITVPAGTFTATPVRQTNAVNASATVNYWSASVGFWIRVSSYNDTGQEGDRMELSSFRYQGGGWLGYLNMTFFGFPLLYWLIGVVALLVIVALLARRRKRRRRVPQY